MSSIKISVVIPAYNEEKLIGRCVDAVKNQTFPKDQYEILVINNNSNDKTEEIAKAHGATVITYTEKQGFSVTKQFGSHQAKGEIIAYTDADTMPDKYWLETIDRLMQNKKYVCVGGTILSTGSIWVNLQFIFFDWIAIINQWFGISLIWSPNMAVRKDAFTQVGGWDTSVKTSDDWVFILRLQKKFGRGSTLYTNALQARTSPRKQKSFFAMIEYIFEGLYNYFSIFILRKAKTVGVPVNVR
jgi:cellulose synthase/poly-beta-1,6-N-acetylglucosamine synthase-like glycosyltransferase